MAHAKMTRRARQSHDERTEANSGPSRANVGGMFDRIAHRYDLLNRSLSFGRDVAWRKKLVDRLPNRDELVVLDLAAGTADVLLTVARRRPNLASGVGLDMSLEMLRYGRDKIAAHGQSDRLQLARGDAMNMPLPAESFDAVTIAFGIRNFERLDRSLDEIRRVLRPGGRLLILEFSLPKNRLMRSLYLLYFRHILPRIGSAISGDADAYRYLNRTVETFPYGREFCGILSAAGFVRVTAAPLTFGIATIYQGERSDHGGEMS